MNDGGLPLGLPGARVLVVGTGDHVPGSVLPEVPAAAGTVHAVAHALTTRCGLDPAHVRTLVDPEDPVAFGEALTTAAEAAETVLVVYYVGHGLVGLDGELYLATRITDHLTRGLAYKALRYSALRETLASSRARSVVLVLDCCFSGRAAPVGGAADKFEASYPGGGFVLASAAPEELALAPAGAPYTAFSGELLRLLEEGDPTGPTLLTLEHVYRSLRRRLRERGFPLPRRQSEGRVGELVLAANPAYRPPDGPARADGSDDGPEPDLDTCPYRGLASFGSEDARFFFGREEPTRELVSAVSAQLSGGGPLMVVGPSGVGKSSLLRAGLLPALDRGLPAAPETFRWPRAVITPGEHPLAQLARVLADLLHRDQESLREELEAEPASVVDRLADGLPESGSRLVLVVDQFEELFTACSDERERERFVRALSAACTPTEDGADPRAVLVLGLRADFYGHCAAYPALAEALRNSQVLVDPMPHEELRNAVEKPARLAGLRLEPGLVDLLLRDLRTGASDRHGTTALPLLSHALLATWQNRAGRTLTMTGYQTAGGVWGAVAHTAQATYDGLDPAAQEAARLLLLRMVRLGEGTEDTRRRVSLAELDRDADPAVAAVLDAFVRARLIVLDGGYAELAHEALLRAWPQLAEWIEHDRAGLLVRQRLHEAADAWERDGRDEGALYRGVRLAAARQWVEESAEHHGTTSAAREFVAAGTARQEAEQRAERRRATRLRVLAVTLSVLLVAAVAGAGVAVRQTWAADEQRDLLASKVGAQAADRLRATDPALALQLALSARRVADTPEARSSLFSAAMAPYYTPLKGHNDKVKKLVYNADRHLLASASGDRTVRLWDLSDPRQATPRAVRDTASDKAGLALSNDGRLLAVEDTDTSVRLWDVTDPADPVAVATLSDTSGSLAFRPDGHLLAAVDKGRSALWDLTDPRRPVRAGALPDDTTSRSPSSFSSDGRLLAATVDLPDGNIEARLWNVTDPFKPVFAAALPQSHALTVAFSPRGPLLAVGTNGRGVQLWDTSDPAKPAQVTQPTSSRTPGPPYSNDPVSIDSTQIVAAVSFSPDGRTLAFGTSTDNGYNVGHAEAMDITDPHVPVVRISYPTSGKTYSVAIGDDPVSLLSASDEKDIRRWHPALDPVIPDTGIEGTFTRDGRVLAWESDTGSYSVDRELRVWRTAGPYDLRPAGKLTVPNGGIVRAVNPRTVLAFSDIGLPQLWDVTDPDHPKPGGTLNEIAPYVEHAGSFSTFETDVALEDGLVAINGNDGRIHVWDVGDPMSPKLLSTVESPQPPGRLHLTKRRLVSVDRLEGHSLRVWDLNDPRHPLSVPPIDFGSSSAMEDRAAGVIALATSGSVEVNPKTIQLWNLNDPQHPDHGQLPSAIVHDFALSHDGHTLAVATDKTIDLWDVTDIRHPVQVRTLAAERQYSVGFSLDDRLLLSHSGSMRKSDPEAAQAHLWRVADPHTADEIGTITTPRPIRITGFNPDGNSLLLNDAPDDGVKGRVYLVDTDIDRLTGRLCEAVGGTITIEQWKQYFPGTPYQPPCRAA